jgi:hypothetical protein
MRLRIVKWIEHLIDLFEDGLPGNDQLTKLVAFIRAYEAGNRTPQQLAAVHQNIYNKWYALSDNNPIGMSVKADIAYAAELATRPVITVTIMLYVAIALCGAYCKAKSPLEEVTEPHGMRWVRGWNHAHFLVEHAWQQKQEIMNVRDT